MASPESPAHGLPTPSIVIAECPWNPTEEALSMFGLLLIISCLAAVEASKYQICLSSPRGIQTSNHVVGRVPVEMLIDGKSFHQKHQDVAFSAHGVH